MRKTGKQQETTIMQKETGNLPRRSQIRTTSLTQPHSSSLRSPYSRVTALPRPRAVSRKTRAGGVKKSFLSEAEGKFKRF